jgi:hypothetical protein
MPRKIERLKKGDKQRTAMHADVMNEIIDVCNMFLSGAMSPQGLGKIVYGDKNWTIEFNTEKCE